MDGLIPWLLSTHRTISCHSFLSQEELEQGLEKVLYWLTDKSGDFTRLNSQTFFDPYPCSDNCLEKMHQSLKQQQQN